MNKKKDYVKVLNFFRDWIKHHKTEDPVEVDIQEPHVVIAVMRACLAQATYTQQGRQSVAQFLHWYQENVERINGMVERW